MSRRNKFISDEVDEDDWSEEEKSLPIELDCDEDESDRKSIPDESMYTAWQGNAPYMEDDEEPGTFVQLDTYHHDGAWLEGVYRVGCFEGNWIIEEMQLSKPGDTAENPIVID